MIFSLRDLGAFLLIIGEQRADRPPRRHAPDQKEEEYHHSCNRPSVALPNIYVWALGTVIITCKIEMTVKCVASCAFSVIPECYTSQMFTSLNDIQTQTQCQTPD